MRLKVLNKFVIIYALLFGYESFIFASATEQDPHDQYQHYWHSHVDQSSSNSKLLSLYIKKEARFKFEREYTRRIINELDQELRSHTLIAGYGHNHLIIGFDVGYRRERDRTDEELRWEFSPLYYDDSITPNSLIVDFNPEHRRRFRLADFYNHCSENYQPADIKHSDCAPTFFGKVMILPDNEEYRQKFERDTGITCTSNNREGKGVHSEGHALAFLYNKPQIFEDIIRKVKNGSNSRTIEACIIKFYSTNDICTSCQNFLLESQQIIQEIFNEKLERISNPKVPVVFVGAGNKIGIDNNYWRSQEGETSGCHSSNPPLIISYKTQAFDYSDHPIDHCYGEAIDIKVNQSMHCLYIWSSPDSFP